MAVVKLRMGCGSQHFQQVFELKDVVRGGLWFCVQRTLGIFGVANFRCPSDLPWVQIQEEVSGECGARAPQVFVDPRSGEGAKATCHHKSHITDGKILTRPLQASRRCRSRTCSVGAA